MVLAFDPEASVNGTSFFDMQIEAPDDSCAVIRIIEEQKLLMEGI